MTKMTTDLSQAIPLCPSGDLQEGGLAVPFDVVYAGQTCRAFAIRFHGGVHAYLNRCAQKEGVPSCSASNRDECYGRCTKKGKFQ